MITIIPAPSGTSSFSWCQHQVKVNHYLHSPVDVRCRPLAYLIQGPGAGPIGCLIFGRPESTRCYTGALTYGSRDDILSGRAQFDRWEIINLARVWLSPDVQPGGSLYHPDHLPGFVDRHGRWRSTLASTAIEMALDCVRLDYLLHHPPCFVDEPYQLRVCLSYCNTNLHRGVIYRASGFRLARRNQRGIETWWKTLPALNSSHDAVVRQRSTHDARARRFRAQRAAPVQMALTA